MRAAQRDSDFLEFVREQRLHSIYIVGPEEIENNPIKIGVAVDPLSRFSEIQVSNFIPLKLFDHFWMAGRAVTLRVERAVHQHFDEHRVRGEWFQISIENAASAIKSEAANINAWCLREHEVVEYAKQERKRHDRNMFKMS